MSGYTQVIEVVAAGFELVGGVIVVGFVAAIVRGVRCTCGFYTTRYGSVDLTDGR